MVKTTCQKPGRASKRNKERVKSIKGHTQPWNVSAPLTGQQAIQRQQTQEQNKTVETPIRNLQNRYVLSPVINIGGQQQASVSSPVPEEWGQKSKKVALAKIKRRDGDHCIATTIIW